MVGSAGRKLLLSVHIASSVGWMGAVAAFIALDLTTALSHNILVLRAAYIAMGVLTKPVIVPLAVVAFSTGIWISLATKWSLFRHYWVTFSLILTAIATAVLLAKVPQITYDAAVAADASSSDVAIFGLGNLLPHSIGGLVVLAIILVLNIYKPRGLTPYGQRRQGEP